MNKIYLEEMINEIESNLINSRNKLNMNFGFTEFREDLRTIVDINIEEEINLIGIKVLKDALKKDENYIKSKKLFSNLTEIFKKYEGEEEEKIKNSINIIRDIFKTIDDAKEIDKLSEEINLLLNELGDSIKELKGEIANKEVINEMILKIIDSYEDLNNRIDEIFEPYYKALKPIEELENIYDRHSLFVELSNLGELREIIVKDCIYMNEDIKYLYADIENLCELFNGRYSSEAIKEEIEGIRSSYYSMFSITEEDEFKDDFKEIGDRIRRLELINRVKLEKLK